MMLSDFASVLVLTVLLQPTHQGPVQLGSEDQSLDQSFPYVPNEPPFGQRLHPLRSSTRQSSVPPLQSLSSTYLSTPLSTPLTEIEEYNEPLQQRSLLTGDPIEVNKSEGACAFEGRVYQSGENIQRNHLCHFCFCRNGYIDCYWKNCPPAPEGCIELNYEGVCERSLYHCPIPTKKNILPRVVRSSRYERHISSRNATSLGCDILGVTYRVGELVGVATDPCLECRCAINALYCSPKCCFQPAEPDDVSQQLQRSAGHQSAMSNPLQHLRSVFSHYFDSA